MKERPILFSAPMVQALLDGSKTQTRRIENVETTMGRPSITGPRHGRYARVYLLDHAQDLRDIENACPYGKPGDQLWVREAWRTSKVADELKPSLLVGGGLSPIWYEAQNEVPFHPSDFGKLRPSIFMPRWASRITLEITGVRVERLQDISEADAWAEGCTPGTLDDYGRPFPAEEPDPSGKSMRDWDCAKDWYADLWEDINGDGSWDANPWVWVVEFKAVKP